MNRRILLVALLLVGATLVLPAAATADPIPCTVVTVYGDEDGSGNEDVIAQVVVGGDPQGAGNPPC